jgi:DNA adenine methylase
MDTDALIDALGEEFLAGIPQPSRPMAPFRWVGGKGNLARWILRYLPKGHIYVEPFAGAASVFWHLPEPYPVEVLNDLDQRIVNLYRVLQDREKFRELLHRLIWTPYSRAEFARALEILKDPEADEVSRAWAFFVAQNQGFGGKARAVGHWGRSIAKIDRGMSEAVNKWRGRLKVLSHWHRRLSRVQIDSIDGVEAIRYWDTPDTVFYVDPPYIPESRADYQTVRYHHEFPLEDHQRLVGVLLQVKGKVLLSAYDHPAYRPLEEAGWVKVGRVTACHVFGRTRASGVSGPGSVAARAPRTEVLWMNFEPSRAADSAPPLLGLSTTP